MTQTCITRRCRLSRLTLLFAAVWIVSAALLPVSIQAQFFGRNKVNYTQFDWQVLKTDHFDIYYYPEMKALAERAAAYAEETYGFLESKFNVNVAGRVPMIFYSSHLHFEQTNVTPGFIPEGVGGFFEFLKGRVVIPADGNINQFKRVIRHELVHVFQYTKTLRVLRDHRQPQDRALPLWFTEGHAEYWSGDVDTQSEMVIRDAVMNNYIVPVSQMVYIYGTYLMYKEGENVCKYIAEKYGEEKILQLYDNFWKSPDFGEVMKLTLGKSPEEFDKEWLYDLRKKYYPNYKDEDNPSQIALTLASRGFNSKPVFYKRTVKPTPPPILASTDNLLAPRPKPDSTTREVYYISNRLGYTSLYRTSMPTAERLSLLSAMPGAEPPNEMILKGEQTDEFEAFHPFQSKMDVCRAGILAFVTKSGETDAIHLYDLNTEQLIKTASFKDLISLGSVSWSPDGTRIAFSAIARSGHADLYIYNTLAGNLTKLTNDFYDDKDPAWSPDGKRIAFCSDRTEFGNEGKYNLFLFDLETLQLTQLTRSPDNYYAPAWSPDGSKLAFTADITDGSHSPVQNIWAMDFVPGDSLGKTATVPGRTMHRITNLFTAAYDAKWTDQDELVFTAFENFSFQIRVVEHVSEKMHASNLVRRLDFPVDERPDASGDSNLAEQTHSQWDMTKIAAIDKKTTSPYQKQYQLDFAQSTISQDPVFGTTGGAAAAFSDVLGNDEYFFLLYNNATSSSELLSSFNFLAARYISGNRANHGYGVYRFAGPRYDLTDPDEFFNETAYGGFFSLAYPISKFRRFETRTSLTYSYKDAYVRQREALLLSNAISYIHDTSLWGPTGPVDGFRLNLTLGYTSDVYRNNVNYFTAYGDFRNYLRIASRITFASRLFTLYNEGSEARRYFLGGSWDLRGYERFELRGKKVWLVSNELRFPLIDEAGFLLPFGFGLGVQQVRGALFFDAGSAWDNTYRSTEGSLGLGLRVNFLGAIVLRYDVGRRFVNNFAALNGSTFYQFFFGWDF